MFMNSLHSFSLSRLMFVEIKDSHVFSIRVLASSLENVFGKIVCDEEHFLGRRCHSRTLDRG